MTSPRNSSWSLRKRRSTRACSSPNAVPQVATAVPHAGQVAGHHVGVALDDHGLRGAGDLAPGQVDAVEHLALLVDRRLGGVEVLRLDPVVVEDPARAEADGVAARVADRPQQPAAEAVVAPSGPRATSPPATSSSSAERLGPQVLEQRLAVARARSRCRTARPPPGRSRARRGTAAPTSASGVASWLGVELLGLAVGLDQPLPRAGPWDGPRGRRPPRAAAARRTCRRAARPTRRRSSPSIFIRKLMTSPPSPQPKQCQNWRAGVTWKDGDFSSWKGHRPFMRAAAGVAQRDVGGDDLVDARLLAHLGDARPRESGRPRAESTGARRAPGGAPQGQ